MGTTLRLMTDDEVRTWVARSRAGLVAELIAAGRDADQASARVSAQYVDWFPDDRPAEGHHLYAVEQDGTNVASIWLGPHPNRPRDGTVAWLYDIEVEAARRRRGLGRVALALAEDAARSAGVTRLELNVFGSNEPARALYRSTGYAELAITMGKSLSQIE